MDIATASGGDHIGTAIVINGDDATVRDCDIGRNTATNLVIAISVDGNSAVVANNIVGSVSNNTLELAGGDAIVEDNLFDNRASIANIRRHVVRHVSGGGGNTFVARRNTIIIGPMGGQNRPFQLFAIDRGLIVNNRIHSMGAAEAFVELGPIQTGDVLLFAHNTFLSGHDGPVFKSFGTSNTNYDSVLIVNNLFATTTTISPNTTLDDISALAGGSPIFGGNAIDNQYEGGNTASPSVDADSLVVTSCISGLSPSELMMTPYMLDQMVVDELTEDVAGIPRTTPFAAGADQLMGPCQ